MRDGSSHSKIHIVGAIKTTEAQRSRLIQLGATYIADKNPTSRDDDHEIQKRVGDADIAVINIASPIRANTIRQCKNLKLIQTWSTGVDHIDVQAARESGIRVCNVPDFSTEAVAEKTLGLMILAANSLIAANNHAKKGGWDFTRFVGQELSGKNLLLVGGGRIGSRVQDLAEAFGMKVDIADSKTTSEQLNKLVAQADFISLHCPFNASTHHKIGRDLFEKMKDGVIIINNSRGGVLDEDSLLQFLNNGKVRFATLDVFEKEPPAQDNPLLNHERVFVTPHSAWNTEGSVVRLTDGVIANIESFLSGKIKNEIL